MSSIISYQNYTGQALTEQQISLESDYIKCFEENGTLFKEEYYKKRELVRTKYIVYSETEIQTLLDSDDDCVIQLRTVDGLYSIVDSRSYKLGVIVSQTIQIYNSLQQKIAFKKRVLLNDQLVDSYVEKFYYENNEEKYIFEYKHDGSCFIIHDQIYYENDIFGWDIGDPTKTDFTWLGYEYYEFADPINPNDLIIV